MDDSGVNLLDSFSKLFEHDSPFSDKTSKLNALAALLMELKVMNRDQYTKLKDVKRKVQSEKAKFDERSIGLQSAQYEHAQLESEILDCKSYPSKYQNLEMVPLEEFMLSTMQDGETMDPHALTLARLKDELDRRKKMMDEVKLAEIRRDAEKEQLAKLSKELENLRDHSKTIYKMASSYKLTSSTASPKLDVRKAISSIQRVYEELSSFCADREGWKVERFIEEISQAGTEGTGDDEEGAIEATGEDEGEGVDEERHASKPAAKRSRRFDFEYIEVLPPVDFFNGSILFYRSIPSDQGSPIVVTVSVSFTDDIQSYLQSLPLEASMALSAPLVEGSLPGIPYKWLQVAAGLDSDISFSDAQRCFSALFDTLHEHKNHGDVPAPEIEIVASQPDQDMVIHEEQKQDATATSSMENLMDTT